MRCLPGHFQPIDGLKDVNRFDDGQLRFHIRATEGHWEAYESSNLSYHLFFIMMQVWVHCASVRARLSIHRRPHGPCLTGRPEKQHV